MAQSPGFYENQRNRNLFEKIVPNMENRYGIPVDTFIGRFEVSDSLVKETLHKYPTLCYLLGSVTDKPQRSENNFGVKRNVFYLTEGSGMFGLRNKDDALEWKGIFNHTVGSARHTYFLFNKLSKAIKSDPKIKEKLQEEGFDFSEFDLLDAETLRDFMLMDHLTRRQYDEKRWYGIDDDWHPATEVPGETAEALLQKYNAHTAFQNLIRVEKHLSHLKEHVTEDKKKKRFRNIIDALLTYADWTFEQAPMTLEERFRILREKRGKTEQNPKGDLDMNLLDLLELCGKYFETTMNNVFSTNIFDELKQVDPYDWETEVRRAYGAPSDLTLKDVFPGYLQQFPQVK